MSRRLKSPLYAESKSDLAFEIIHVRRFT